MRNFDRDPMILIHDVARMMRTRFDRWARTYGLTRAQGVILARLSLQPCLSQNELANVCDVEPITVGRLVDRLEARGLIERRPDPSDRRIKRLYLLPASEPILAAIHAYREEVRAYVCENLDGMDLEIFTDVLVHMKNKLTMEDAGEKPAAGKADAMSNVRLPGAAIERVGEG